MKTVSLDSFFDKLGHERKMRESEKVEGHKRKFAQIDSTKVCVTDK